MNAKDVRAVARARWERRKGKWTPANVVLVTLAAVLVVTGFVLMVVDAPRDGERVTYELESGAVLETARYARPSVDGVPLKNSEPERGRDLAWAGIFCIMGFAVVTLVWLLADLDKRRGFADDLVEYWALHHDLPPQDWMPTEEAIG